VTQRKTLNQRQLAADLLEIAATLKDADVTAIYIARLWLLDLANALPQPRELDIVDAEERSYHARVHMENHMGITDSQAVS
jgi:hypothetical protein